MADDRPFYSPQAKHIPPRPRTPGELVWSLRKKGHQIDCELHFRGESWGWECQCFRRIHSGAVRGR